MQESGSKPDGKDAEHTDLSAFLPPTNQFCFDCLKPLSAEGLMAGVAIAITVDDLLPEIGPDLSSDVKRPLQSFGPNWGSLLH